ncbi:MAG: hypothetical protein ABGY42_15655, partial [bacterium]
RQSSINSSQAELDADGVFRAVIAHQDPGIANWLDPVGRNEGSLGLRYLFPDGVTQPSFTVVPANRVLHSLPDTTARVDAEQRRTRLERRRRAVQLRYGY